jgi:hypothetical protein
MGGAQRNPSQSAPPPKNRVQKRYANIERNMKDTEIAAGGVSAKVRVGWR